MASDRFVNIMIGSLITILFAFLIVNSALNIGYNYGQDLSRFEDSRFDMLGMNETLGSAETSAESWLTSFTEGKIFSGIAGLITTGIRDVLVTVYTFIVAPIEITQYILIDILYFPNIVVQLFLTLIKLLVLFGLWRLLMTGD